MRIGILHSYQLSGSGSCVYVRSLATALGKLPAGHEVHVISSEPEPQAFSEVRLAFAYRDGRQRELFRRHGTPGSFISHTLEQPFHPIAYPRAEMDSARSPLFTQLTDVQMAQYLDGLFEQISEIVVREKITVLHAHHMGPKAVVAARIRRRLGIPYVVTVHGTFFEYVVRRDRRFLPWAQEGLANADRVIALNEDVRQRILSVQPGLEDRIVILPVGVDLERFAPLLASRRPRRVTDVCDALEESSQGGMDDRTRAGLHDAAAEALSPDQIVEIVQQARMKYVPTQADRGLGERLRRVDWSRAQTVVYLGKLLVDKGVHCLIASAFEVLRGHPDAQVLVIGNGAFREGLELLAGALFHQNRGVIEALARVVPKVDSGASGLDHLLAWLPAELPPPPDRWLERIVFCGYLTTAQIAQMLPLCQVSVVPSLIPEAFPLVVLEAASCGVLPVGTPAGGLRHVLDEMAAVTGPLGGSILVDMNRSELVNDLAGKLSHIVDHLADPNRAKAVQARCREFAEDGFSWDSVAARIGELFEQLVAGH